ncbi:MAG: DUF3617 domain-containing protein [Leptonema sp. (in: bacteria)]
MKNKHFLLLILTGITIMLCNKPKEESEKKENPKIQTGLWEYKIKMEAKGMQLPEVTFKNCVKEDDYIPKPEERENDQCKVIKQSFDGKTAEWELECTMQGVISKMIGKANYTQDSMEGEITIIMNQDKMIQKIAGKYLGACKK